MRTAVVLLTRDLRVHDNPALTAPLRAVADKGVPSETQLAVEFPQAAMKVKHLL